MFGDAANKSQREGRKARQRGETGEEAPQFGQALANGDVSGEHVDLLGSALRGAEEAKRKQLAAKAGELVEVAKSSTPEEFAHRLRDELRRLDRDDGTTRLDRQRASSRLWHRADPVTGMGKIWTELDPLSYAKFVARNDAAVAALFADRVPERCPIDPVEKQAFLRAMAFVASFDGDGPSMGRPELIVVLDGTALDDAGQATSDWGVPVELPGRCSKTSYRTRWSRRWWCEAGSWCTRRVSSTSAEVRASRDAAQRRVLRGCTDMWHPRLSGSVPALQGASRGLVATRRAHRPRELAAGVRTAPHGDP